MTEIDAVAWGMFVASFVAAVLYARKGPRLPPRNLYVAPAPRRRGVEFLDGTSDFLRWRDALRMREGR